ncbi:hypothetical protein B0H66DRAFT_306703 [Apodospora peruviana]|uniref:Heterokaryon incompatibility domain-containing protein n=1 Tax=Apodospora peruviana TaxID=516989 RepID=A0AAE0I1Z0_9PEZI|nr:hypothetical protein B0H66DRAFT_306703 [Apodospora peruviana]
MDVPSHPHKPDGFSLPSPPPLCNSRSGKLQIAVEPTGLAQQITIKICGLWSCAHAARPLCAASPEFVSPLFQPYYFVGQQTRGWGPKAKKCGCPSFPVERAQEVREYRHVLLLRNSSVTDRPPVPYQMAPPFHVWPIRDELWEEKGTHRECRPDATYFGGEEWRDVWPEEPEPGCLAACFVDWRPTDADARVSGLGHTYLSVVANEGLRIFCLILIFGLALGGLSAWLIVHIVQTKHLIFIIPLVPAFALTVYCCGFLGLKYRLRRLLYELVLFCIKAPFLLLRRCGSTFVRICGVLFRAPVVLMARFWVIRQPRYRNVDEQPVLCFACRRMVSGSRLLTGSSALFCLTKATERWQHHSHKGLQESAQQCHLCNVLCQSTSRTKEKFLEAENFVGGTKLTVKLWEETFWARRGSELWMQLEGYFQDGFLPVKIVETNFKPRPGPDTTDEKLASTASGGSSSTWTITHEWIQRCQQHELCQNNFPASDQGGFLPTRLLEITPGFPTCTFAENAEMTCTPTLRLVETAGMDRSRFLEEPGCSYVALSHFFGDMAEDPDLARLTRTNIDKLLFHISFESLPPTFRDAISITAKLGFQYVWIDSLCILQDSEEDFLLEAAHRGLIFSNAACTISAATSSPEGCLAEKPRFPIDKECQLLTDNKRGSALVARIAGSHSGDRDGNNRAMDSLFKKYVESQALYRWSWTAFQERLLSRRIIHFCADGVVLFECNTMRASEHPQYRKGVPYLPPFASDLKPPPKKHQEHSNRQQGDSKRRFNDVNHDYPSGKLPQRPPVLHLTPHSPTLSIPGSPGLTYGYHTRKKTVDRTSGVFKFETLVLTRPSPQPSVQQHLRSLCTISAWRKHCGSLEWWPNKLALHAAWLGLVGAYSATSSLINKTDSDKARKRLLGLSGVADLVTQAHSYHSGMSLGPYVCGLWLELLPANLLWFRVADSVSDEGSNERPRKRLSDSGGGMDWKPPTWSWVSVDGQVTHNLPDRLATETTTNHGLTRFRLPIKSRLHRPCMNTNTDKADEEAVWHTVDQLINQTVQVFDDGWKELTPADLSANTNIMNSNGMKLRIRNFISVVDLSYMMSEERETITVIYDDPYFQSQPDRSSGTIYGLPILELRDKCDQGNWHLWKREMHGIAVRVVGHVPRASVNVGRQVFGETEQKQQLLYERVGYFCIHDSNTVRNIMCLDKKPWGVVWLQ